MNYKSIATVVHDAAHPNPQLDMAIALADRFGAHLHVIAAGIDVTDPGFSYAGAHVVVAHQNLDAAQKDADEVEALVRGRLRQVQTGWDVQPITIMAPGLTPFLADAMRFHDLVVLPSPYQDGAVWTDEAIFEACLFRTECPVIIAPNGFTGAARHDRILVAWDDSTQALNAARAAIPFIAGATKSTITLIDPPPSSPNRSDPGGALATYLSRHGGRMEISIQARRRTTVASQLIENATDEDISLIVMGAYGHSRLREAILGGATREMLKLTKIPILMAH